ncbi:MAG: hypothetical protein AAFO97_03545 [Pseudomonadota bacterium]
MKTIKMEFGTILSSVRQWASSSTGAGAGTALKHAEPRRLRTCKGGVRALLVATALAVSGFAMSGDAQAAPDVGYDSAPLVVLNDRGGLLLTRLRQMGKLRAESRPVQIRGGICYSTCTMLMGLPNACISPTTVFGFHGPSSYGRTLDQATFERASAVIASYYPEPLQEWYMNDARYTINGVRRVRGETIINMGVASC